MPNESENNNETGASPHRLSEKQYLTYELQADFEAEPVLDGMNHEAENTLSRAMASIRPEDLLPWLTELATDASRPVFSSSVLRCIGRLPALGDVPWRQEVVARALRTDDVEVREAAVQAAEQWGDRDLADTLAAHHEPEPWIRQYLEGVISDLRE